MALCSLLLTTVQFRALPIELNVSAWANTQATSDAVSYLHETGIAVPAYIDDWLVYHPPPSTAAVHRNHCLVMLLWKPTNEVSATEYAAHVGYVRCIRSCPEP
jgi:hypothetical protein